MPITKELYENPNCNVENHFITPETNRECFSVEHTQKVLGMSPA